MSVTGDTGVPSAPLCPVAAHQVSMPTRPSPCGSTCDEGSPAAARDEGLSTARDRYPSESLWTNTSQHQQGTWNFHLDHCLITGSGLCAGSCHQSVMYNHETELITGLDCQIPDCVWRMLVKTCVESMAKPLWTICFCLAMEVQIKRLSNGVRSSPTSPKSRVQLPRSLG